MKYEITMVVEVEGEFIPETEVAQLQGMNVLNRLGVIHSDEEPQIIALTAKEIE